MVKPLHAIAYPGSVGSERLGFDFQQSRAKLRSGSAINAAVTPARVTPTNVAVMKTTKAPPNPKRNVFLNATAKAARATALEAGGRSFIAVEACSSASTVCHQLVSRTLERHTCASLKCSLSSLDSVIWYTAPEIPTPKTCPRLRQTKTKPVDVAISFSTVRPAQRDARNMLGTHSPPCSAWRLSSDRLTGPTYSE